MNNMMIILKEAVASGFYTEQEIENIVAEGKMPDFHTYAVWKRVYGMVPKRGTKGWETRLWRKRDKNNDTYDVDVSDTDMNREFYLTKSFLFHISQMEVLNR